MVAVKNNPFANPSQSLKPALSNPFANNGLAASMDSSIFAGSAMQNSSPKMAKAQESGDSSDIIKIIASTLNATADILSDKVSDDKKSDPDKDIDEKEDEKDKNPFGNLINSITDFIKGLSGKDDDKDADSDKDDSNKDSGNSWGEIGEMIEAIFGITANLLNSDS